MIIAQMVSFLSLYVGEGVVEMFGRPLVTWKMNGSSYQTDAFAKHIHIHIQDHFQHGPQQDAAITTRFYVVKLMLIIKVRCDTIILNIDCIITTKLYSFNVHLIFQLRLILVS